MRNIVLRIYLGLTVVAIIAILFNFFLRANDLRKENITRLNLAGQSKLIVDMYKLGPEISGSMEDYLKANPEILGFILSRNDGSMLSAYVADESVKEQNVRINRSTTENTVLTEISFRPFPFLQLQEEIFEGEYLVLFLAEVFNLREFRETIRITAGGFTALLILSIVVLILTSGSEADFESKPAMSDSEDSTEVYREPFEEISLSSSHNRSVPDREETSTFDIDFSDFELGNDESSNSHESKPEAEEVQEDRHEDYLSQLNNDIIFEEDSIELPETLLQEIDQVNPEFSTSALIRRIEKSLKRMISEDLDISLVKISGKSVLDKGLVKQTFSNNGFELLNLGDSQHLIILPETDIDTALSQAQDLSKQDGYQHVTIGIASRTSRLLTAQRLYKEAVLAHKKSRESNRIIAFYVDATKYRDYMLKKNRT
jgi:hypothetical protein